MKNPMKIALLTLGLAGGVLTVDQSAMADNVTVGIGNGGIAFGYNDGYWDRAHTWHAWQNREEADRWRAENREHYYEWKHDRDADQGWREEHWWDRH